MANAGEVVVKIVGDNSELDRALTASQRKMQQAGQAMQRVGKSLTTFVTLPILAIGAAAIKSAANLELQQAAFETMLGSADKAKVLLQDLTNLAAKTPFQLPDLAEGTKTLLAFGTAADDVLPILGQLGDISLGDSQRLKQLALVYGQVQSAGRLMGQDLLQLINVGFNPLQLISKQTGETMAELKKRMEAGAVSAEEVAAAFKIATSEGGQFFGGMERASTTLAGKFSTLMDNVGILGRSFADVLMPALKDIVDWATKLVQKWAALDEGTKKVILIVAGFAAAIGPLLLVVGTLTVKMIALNVAMAANPAIAIGLAIAGVAAALTAGGLAIATAIRNNREYKAVLLATTQQIRQMDDEERRLGLARLERARQDVQGKLIENFRILGEAQETVTRLTRLGADATREQFAELGRAGIAMEGSQRRLVNLRVEMNDITGQIDEFNKAVADTAPPLENFTEDVVAATDATDALAGAIDDLTEAYKKAGYTIGEDFNVPLMESGDIFGQLGLVIGEDFNKALLESGQIWEDVNEEEQTFIDNTDKTLAAIALRNGIYEAQRLNLENLRGLLAEMRDEEIDAAKEVADFNIAIFGGMADSLATIFNNLGEAKGESDRKQAERTKLLGIFEATINGIVAVTKVLDNPLLAIATAIQAALQVAAIASTPLPALARGGIVTQPTTALVGEGGQPEVIFPLDQLQDFLGGTDGGGQHLTINFDSKPIYDGILPATRDRRVLVDLRAVV